VHNDKDSLHLYTDGSFRTCAAFGWTLRDSSDQEIDSGSGSLGPFCTAFDGEVAAIENGISALLRCRQPFNHVTVHSDSTAAIARVQHNKRGPGQSRAVKVIRHVQRLRNQGKRLSIQKLTPFLRFPRTWTDPLTGEFTRPSSIGQLLGNPRWEKRLLKFLQRTKIGRIGPDLIDDEIRRVTRYEGWTDLVPDERSIDRGEQVADHILDTIVVRQT
jgi:ribonuclease HI